MQPSFCSFIEIADKLSLTLTGYGFHALIVILNHVRGS